jgi:hypothetical protein
MAKNWMRSVDEGWEWLLCSGECDAGCELLSGRQMKSSFGSVGKIDVDVWEMAACIKSSRD